MNFLVMGNPTRQYHGQNETDLSKLNTGNLKLGQV